jgi:hypothetical protein
VNPTTLPPRHGNYQHEQYLTVEDVAGILAISTDTVTRQFEHAEGVLDLGTPGTLHRRRKRVLRIPRRTLERFIAERQVRQRSR